MNAEKLPCRAYRFDRFVLNLQRGALLGLDGAELPLRPKSFALLQLLVENAGQLLNRDTIMEAVWPDVFVTDDSITQCVGDIRRALGDEAQRLVRTIPRRGYLLTAEVSRIEPIKVSPREEPQASAGQPAVPASPFAGTQPSTAITIGTDSTQAERRQLTVMFVDLVGSTALSSRLDPEEMREVIRAYQSTVTEEILRYEGYIARFMGDGVLAYFGWPKAHEDEAERAVRAGLAIAGAVREIPGSATGARQQARVGIATGLVVVGDLIRSAEAQERSAVGESVNLAARLQDLAEPGGVVIAETTRRLLGERFDLAHLGARALKGFAKPVSAFAVIGECLGVESRFDARQSSAPLPMVGRDQELSLILERWHQSKEGEGQVVLLSGEPGIGKSRLVLALRQRLQAEPQASLSYHCSPFHQTSSLHPFIAHIERAAKFAAADSPDRRLEKLKVLFNHDATDPAEAVALVAALLAIPVGGGYPALPSNPQKRMERTLTALVEQLSVLTGKQPVLMVFEDAHWSDPTSLELLDLIIDRVQHLPVLVIVTFRPEFTPLWSRHAHVTALTLTRLTRRQVALLVEQLTADKPLPNTVIEQIAARTDGVPLFVEELTKAVLESELLTEDQNRYVLSKPLLPLAIPATLHDSLMARLDHLSSIKEVAQLGAVLGREFPYALLAAVASMGEAELRKALDRLVSSELVYRRGTPPEASYTFKHALVQAAAYGSLLHGRRQHLHSLIVRVLEEQFSETVLASPDLLAHHCTQAGAIDKAVGYWYKAGQQAVARAAMTEAVARFNKALDLLAGLPEDRSRHFQEVDLQIALGNALIASRGPVCEVGDAFARAWDLCRELGEPPQTASALLGMSFIHTNRAEVLPGCWAAEDLVRFAKRRHDGEALIMGMRSLGVSLFFQGRLADAIPYLEQALALYDPECRLSGPALVGQDIRVAALSFMAVLLFLRGYPDQSLARSREALVAARSIGHPYSLAFCLYFNCLLHQLRHEPAVVEERSRELTELAAEQGFTWWLAAGTFFQGWAMPEGGSPEARLARMREGSDARKPAAAVLLTPFFFGQLAWALARLDRAADGLLLLADALARVEHTGERWYEAEVHRLRGELLLSMPDRAEGEAEACFQRAIAVAQEQGAKLWELRAAMSLARQWRDQGRCADARSLLAPIYGWFSEGFDTADLQETKIFFDQFRGM